MTLPAAEIAVRFGCELHGDPDTPLGRVATLVNAGEGAVSFLANPRYRSYLANTQASAVILAPEHRNECPVTALVAENPYAVYARVAQLLHPDPPPAAGIHPSAVIGADTQIAPSAEICAGVVVETGACIGERAFIGPNSVIGARVRIGADTRLHPSVTVCHDVTLGERVVLHPGAIVGADGFGYAQESGAWVKVPQIGGVVVGDDVEIGAGTTVDRGAVDDTVLEAGVKLDNQIQIAHNVCIGEHTIIAACSWVSGSTVIGKRCMIGGAVGFVGHLKIADDVVVTGQTMVNRSISEAGVYSSALPMDDARRWRRNSARFRKLDELAKRVAKLEKKRPPEADEE